MMSSKKLVRLKMLHVVQGVKLHRCIRKLSQNSIIEIDWYWSKFLIRGNGYQPKWLWAQILLIVVMKTLYQIAATSEAESEVWVPLYRFKPLRKLTTRLRSC